MSEPTSAIFSSSTVKSFMEKEIFPHEDLVDRLGEVPIDLGRQIEKRAKEVGLFAANLPVDVGGGGLDYRGMAFTEREYGKTSHALHSWIARPTELLLACEGEQVERYLVPCVHGRKARALCADRTRSRFRHHVDEVECAARR